jgi:hypothetical protein
VSRTILAVRRAVVTAKSIGVAGACACFDIRLPLEECALGESSG